MPTYFNLSTSDFTENWNSGSLSGSAWPATSSIVGYLGDYTTSSPTNVDARTLTAATSLGTESLISDSTSSNPSSGAVYETTVAGDTTIALNGSGSADAPSIVLFLDSTGRQNVSLSFDVRDLDSSADNAVQQINVQYRTSPDSDWINVPGGYLADATIAGATQTTAISVGLPAGAANSATLQVRIMTTNAGGNDELVGIDNIVVASSELSGTIPGSFSVDDVAVAEGDAGTGTLTFTVTRSGGSDGSVTVDYSMAHGSTDDADVALTSGTLTFADGVTSKTISVTVTGDLVAEASESFTITLANPTGGATIADGSGTGTIVNDDMPPIANVWINEFHYDPSSSPETGEFIEIAGQAGIDLSGYRLVFYNGSNNAPYALTGGSTNGLPLSGVLADSANGFGFEAVMAPGFQNGSPDGIALVDPFGRVIQFLSYEGTITAVSGPAAGMTSTDIGRYEDQASPGTSLQLAGTGSTYGDFYWTHGNANTADGANQGQSFLSGSDQGQIRIDNGQVIEGDAGQSQLVFTLHRSGGFDTETSVAYSLTLGSADAADLAPGTPLSGTATFAAGALTTTITLAVNGDVAPEYNETMFVNLGAVSGNAVVVDAIAVGTIINDDPLPLTIMEIQGESHSSAFLGQPVLTSGIVTAIDSNGFFLQDPNGDGNAATSDALFVYTGGAPSVAVGDAVDISGQVGEFGSDLTTTQVSVTSGSVTVTSSGNPLPAAVLVGAGGLIPPTQSIDSDGLTVFNPSVDGIDFWESLEGMRVTIDNPLVVESSNAFGETYVVSSGGAGATGVNDRGGITISEGDYNPEMIQIDDKLVAGDGYVADHSTGDQLASVTGVINYSFGHYELLLTEADVQTTIDVTLAEDVTTLVGDANHLSIATYNVENLDPSDMKYEAIANDIAVNLKLPDIIALQEVQDNDGAGRGADLSAAANIQGLIDAIFVQSGVLYTYVEIAPDSANSTGGEANGNIRNGYLYRDDRVDLVEGSLQQIDDSSYSNQRLPLIATWEFNGEQVTTVNVHMYARSGSDPLWGADQPPSNSGDDRRTDQSEAISTWVENNLATDPAMNIVLLGDWNGFYFEDSIRLLTEDGIFANMQEVLLSPEERYSYIFEGNSQLIDHVLATGGLMSGAAIDGVHINAQFGGETSDHDPQVALFFIAVTPFGLVLSNASADENLPAGTVVGTASAQDSASDTLTYSLTDNGGGRFAIDAQTGIITTIMALDHEALASISVTVRATDTAGLFTEQSFAIAIGDVNEAPVAGADAVAVAEDATSANLWATLLANDSDVDDGDSRSIVSVDASGTLGSVIFDPTTQTLRYVADDDSFDALANGTSAIDSFSYTIADSAGLLSTATVTVTVAAVNDSLVLSGSNGKDWLFGGAGEDQLSGGNGDDLLWGMDGHDQLSGGNGNDRIDGGFGNDTIDGGRGNDRMTGGEGDDVFLFGKASGNDIIVDFDLSSDSIRLLDGATVKSSSVGDLDGDGIADLLINFSGGGSVGLLGVGSIDEVQFEGSALAALASFDDGGSRSSMGWQVGPVADPLVMAHDDAMLAAHLSPIA